MVLGVGRGLGVGWAGGAGGEGGVAGRAHVSKHRCAQLLLPRIRACARMPRGLTALLSMQ